VLVVLALLAGLGACSRPVPPPTVAVACDSLRLVVDSLRARAAEQRVLFRLAEQQMKRYAKIVARDPGQTRFIVGWTTRAFAGVLLPDSGR
jgi:hypothetical protein